ncbi:class F sortase [Candidatus Viridilinea mediisalina]|uniref:Sortase n=1 Tax=Candidatus Viridilinea mediisalina TaxID=2024553 RepID=A0A2A6RMR8_9CHLR|nr:class F sortase [Candidatus Viridilinea mediisalina]PDW04215.1 sortase [Candidatus Viridilinea mediisalina]
MLAQRIVVTIILFALVVLGLLHPQPAHAQGERCFSETSYCIAGEIRRFWEQSGGLPVFGFPITPLQEEVIEGRRIQVQWFERHRLELHPNLAPPYRVQLGRLGVDRLARDGRSGVHGNASSAEAGCHFFPETGHTVCGEFLANWRSAGVELDGQRGFSAAENLALFGLPISAPQEERLSDGNVYLVQWFERARMELHPDLPAGRRILNGLLGAEMEPQAQARPQRSQLQPVRISIPAIGLDTQIVSVGLDAQAVPIVPHHDVGWYNLSAVPSEGDNVVLWGHVLRWSHAPHIPAPFAQVRNLQLGATIIITTRNGEQHSYRVSAQRWVRPDEVSYILPQGSERLTLVSCIGDQVIQDGSVVDMSHRLITIATR